MLLLLHPALSLNRCADSFVDTPPLVLLGSECSGFDSGSKCLEERVKIGQSLVDGNGYMWGHDLASGQGTWKVQECHCQSSVRPGGELTLHALFAFVLHVL